MDKPEPVDRNRKRTSPRGSSCPAAFVYIGADPLSKMYCTRGANLVIAGWLCWVNLCSIECLPGQTLWACVSPRPVPVPNNSQMGSRNERHTTLDHLCGSGPDSLNTTCHVHRHDIQPCGRRSTLHREGSIAGRSNRE